MNRKIAVVLHNVRSSHNVGSIFRTADGAGVGEVLLVGYTPTPTDRYGKLNKEIAKTALGAEKHIPWRKFGTMGACTKTLKREGYALVAVEQSPRSIQYTSYKSPRKVAFVFGNEVRGLSKSTLSHVDKILEIPMHGKKESLNVSVAAGIVLFGTI